MRNLVKCLKLILLGILAVSTCYGEDKQTDKKASPTQSESQVCQGGIFFANTNPASEADGKYELGIKFHVSESGKIKEFCFYQAKKEKGPHIFKLWSSDGKKLLAVKVDAVDKAGWVSIPLEKPFAVSANTEYIVSYTCNNSYVATPDVFTSPIYKEGIKAISGVYSKDTSGTKAPDKTYKNMHYFIDVIFSKDVKK